MNILVLGFYSKNNAGDEMFKEAFNKLFPEYLFTFTDIITKGKLSCADAVFIGGGSFLNSLPNIDNNAISLLLSKPIFYIGVGAETDIHASHLTLMRSAKLICIRTPDHMEKIRAININTIVAPDIVYALTSERLALKSIENSVLVLPNMNMVPRHSSKYWEQLRWTLFKDEIAQALDILVERDFLIRFYAMDQSHINNDEWAAREIINAMENRDSNYIISGYHGSKSLMNLFSGFDMVISQRYHGVVLAEMCDVHYLSIAHHDKLMNAGYRAGNFLTIKEASKDNILRAIETKNTQKKAFIEQSVFDVLKTRVKEALQLGS